MPRQRQSTGTDAKSQRHRSGFHTVTYTDTHQIMQPGGVHHKAQSQTGSRQGGGDFRRNDSRTLPTPVAMDGVGGNLRGDLRNIFGEPRMLANRFIHRRATLRATRDVMFALHVDVLWIRATDAQVSGFSPRLLVAPFGAGLQVHRLHARRGRGTHRVVYRGGLQAVPLVGFFPQSHNRGPGLAARQIQNG